MKSRRLSILLMLSIFTLSIAFVGVNIKAEAKVTASFGDVLLNELLITPTTPERIELHNTLGSPVGILNWEVYDKYALVGTVDTAITIPANGYVLINDSVMTGPSGGLSLSNQGEILILKDNGGNTIDVMAYGTEGGAPTHPYDATSPNTGYSIARVGTGGTNATDWTVDLTATWGAANDAPGVDLGSTDVIINEVNHAEHFFELFNNNSASSISLDGWWAFRGTADVLDLTGNTISPKSFVYWQDKNAGDFDFLGFQYYGDPSNEVIYLFNASDVRVAQFGWNTNVDPRSWGRYPDGSGTGYYDDGWNNITSGYIPVSPTPGQANSLAEFFVVKDFTINDTTIAINDSFDVSVKVEWTNGTKADNTLVNVSLDIAGMNSTKLTYHAPSEYFIGTVNTTGYTPSVDKYGFYHTAKLVANVTGGANGNTSATLGVLINPGYTNDDTVIMFDEAHMQYYTFSDFEASAEWSSMLLDVGMANYLIALDGYNFPFRMDADVLSMVDLLVITDPESDLSDGWLTTSEVNAILAYVESGGSLWLSASGGAFCEPDKNGLEAITKANWGIDWFDGNYQDPSHNTGSQHTAIASVASPTGSVFGNLDKFGAEEFYYNGMVINHTTQVPGATVTEVIAPTSTSNWDDADDDDYDANMNPLTHNYSLAYLVENGTGMAYVTGSSSIFGHYEDFEDGQESAQYAFNVFGYLLGTHGYKPRQYPILKLSDATEPQNITTADTITFKVKLSSSLSGAKFVNPDVTGTVEGDTIVFVDIGGGSYTFFATFDVADAALSADNYTLTITAAAESATGAKYIPTSMTIVFEVEEAPEEQRSPGFEITTLLTVFALLGLASIYLRKRR